ncbi:unnamed protein product, partial [Brenthis ino]
MFDRLQKDKVLFEYYLSRPKMHRPVNPRVRRRLFEADEITDKAKIDNVANIIKESLDRDKIEKSQKWNFDFENEVPLEGPYEWYKKDGNDWIGMKTEKEKEEFSMKKINEATPKTNTEVKLNLKKRRRNTEKINNIPNREVRRRISFQ